MRGIRFALAAALVAASSHAQIYSWEDGALLSDRAVGPGADLTGLDLDKPDFRGLDLSGADFSDSTFGFPWFDGADLSGATLENTALFGAVFDATDLSDATFVNAYVYTGLCRDSWFDRAVFLGMEIGLAPTGCSFEETVFSTEVEGDFDATNSFLNADFTQASAQFGAAFHACVFDGTKFGPLDQRYSFFDCDFTTAQLDAIRGAFDAFVGNTFDGAAFNEVDYFPDANGGTFQDNSFRGSTIASFSLESFFAYDCGLTDLTDAVIGDLFLHFRTGAIPVCNVVLDGATVTHFMTDTDGIILTSAQNATLDHATIGGYLGGDFTGADLSDSIFLGEQSNPNFAIAGQLEGRFRNTLFDRSMMRIRMDKLDFRGAGFRDVAFVQLINASNGVDESSIACSDIRGADFTGATGWDLYDWTNARYDAHTLLPAGLDPVAEGLIFVSDTIADMTTTHANPGDPGFGAPDGTVNGADLAYFIEAWLDQSLRADVATDAALPGDPEFDTFDCKITGTDLSRYVEIWLENL